MEYKDPRVYYKVDIGFALSRTTRSDMTTAWVKEVQARRRDPELAKKAAANERKFTQSCDCILPGLQFWIQARFRNYFIHDSICLRYCSVC